MPLSHVPIVQSEAIVHGSPTRPVAGALQIDPVVAPAIGWHVVPPYALQSPPLVQPGKQMYWLLPFSTQ
jgi:hypothetical protein